MDTSLEWKIVVGQKKHLPVDTTRQKEKRKTATIMEEPGDGLHEEQRYGRGYGVSEWMDGSWLCRSYIFIIDIINDKPETNIGSF